MLGLTEMLAAGHMLCIVELYDGRRNEVSPVSSRLSRKLTASSYSSESNWALSFTGHAELRMAHRGVTEVEVRAMLERASGLEASVVEGRFMIQTRCSQSPWVVIVEPDAEAKLLVVVTVYDGASVYVRGVASRCGSGTKLLGLAEEHAPAHGAKSIKIQASLAGVAFYRTNGFQELGRGEASLMTGQSMPCVFMRKLLS